MSRSRIRLALSGAVALLTAATLVAPLAMAANSKRAKVQLRATSLGKLLVAGSGFTLYVFTHDKRNKDTCVQINNCTGVWPVLKTNGKPIAGKGVRANLLGTITLAGGGRQVTYGGHPLYRYVLDSGPGETSYVGTPQFGGTWYAINAAGKLVR